jgi:hypothetical protein
MKHSLTILGLFLHLAVFSQISLSTNPAVKTVDLAEFFNKAVTTVKNNSSAKATYVWTVTPVTSPNPWIFQVCDINLCYLPTTLTQEFDLEAGQEGEFYIQVSHNNFRGDGEYKVKFVNKNNPSDSITGTFIFNSTTSTRDITFGDNIKIHPNPANNYFHISDTKQIGKVQVLNLVGGVVKTYYAQNTDQFDISDLPSGMYMVKMIHKNSNKVKTLRLRKS